MLVKGVWCIIHILDMNLSSALIDYKALLIQLKRKDIGRTQRTLWSYSNDSRNPYLTGNVDCIQEILNIATKAGVRYSVDV